MIFKREPAVWLGLARTVIALLIAFGIVELTTDQTALLLTLLSAGMGLAIALAVHPFQWAALTGLVQAIVAAVVGFGVDLTPEQQGVILACVSAVVILFDRSKSTPEVSRPAQYAIAA